MGSRPPAPPGGGRPPRDWQQTMEIDVPDEIEPATTRVPPQALPFAAPARTGGKRKPPLDTMVLPDDQNPPPKSGKRKPVRDTLVLPEGAPTKGKGGKNGPLRGTLVLSPDEARKITTPELPFANQGSTPPPSSDGPPIPGAPWTDEEAASLVPPDSKLASTMALRPSRDELAKLKTLGREDEDPASTPRVKRVRERPSVGSSRGRRSVVPPPPPAAARVVVRDEVRLQEEAAKALRLREAKVAQERQMRAEAEARREADRRRFEAEEREAESRRAERVKAEAEKHSALSDRLRSGLYGGFKN